MVDNNVHNNLAVVKLGLNEDGFCNIRRKIMDIENHLADLRAADKFSQSPIENAFIDHRFIQVVDEIVLLAGLITDFSGKNLDWWTAIRVLKKLEIITPSALNKFRKLRRVRNKLQHHRDHVHFERLIRALQEFDFFGTQIIRNIKIFLEGMSIELLQEKLKEIEIIPMQQTFTIPCELPSLNEIISASKVHWSEYSKLKKEFTKLVAILARIRLRPVQGRVSIEFLWYCKDRRRDPDNICSAKKFIIDGLILGGVLKNDGWRQISSFSDDFLVDKNGPRVEVVLYESAGK